MGFIVLEGGAEFGGQMADPDRLAIKLAGGSDALIIILPTAAAPDNNHRRAGRNGVNWFKSLGATNVSSLPLIDNTSADDPAIVETLTQARLIYLLGGFPRHLAQTLMQSRSWQAILSAYRTGAVIAGSSAGAMVLCKHYYDPASSCVREGLKLIDRICILPHHNTIGKAWVPRLKKLLPNIGLLGIDEETAVISGVSEGFWQVYGKGKATMYHDDLIEEFGPGQALSLPLLNF
ncbi:MAG: Type 1 glutamine amidotransferase-like domain-containing protein [Desulfobacterales bacterium]|nr:MAG: Type 1 glutamine amidotransferase-like domain-containing protein [Desulfobacterales bacterium]